MYGQGIYHMVKLLIWGPSKSRDKAGAWHSYKGDRIGQGKKNACEFLSQNQHLADDIERQTELSCLMMNLSEDDEEPDNVTPISSA